MYGEKAIDLIKELHRNTRTLPPFNRDLTNEVQNEIVQLIQENQTDAHTNEQNRNSGGVSLIPAIRLRHTAVQRNMRCLLAYHYNRLQYIRNMRWEFGSILPPDIKQTLRPLELKWFDKYSANLGQYMRSLGEDDGVNLAINLKPPKVLYIEVRCLTDYGQYELSDGTTILLKNGTRHFLPRSECEELIRQGIFEHVI